MTLCFIADAATVGLVAAVVAVLVAVTDRGLRHAQHAVAAHRVAARAECRRFGALYNKS